MIDSKKVGYRFQTVDKYPPTTQFVHHGVGAPGANDGDRPKSDLHKPYRASPYLRMVQGPKGLWYERSHN